MKNWRSSQPVRDQAGSLTGMYHSVLLVFLMLTPTPIPRRKNKQNQVSCLSVNCTSRPPYPPGKGPPGSLSQFFYWFQNLLPSSVWNKRSASSFRFKSMPQCTVAAAAVQDSWSGLHYQIPYIHCRHSLVSQTAMEQTCWRSWWCPQGCLGWISARCISVWLAILQLSDNMNLFHSWQLVKTCW